MLLNNYTQKIFRPECNPSFESVHCIATLDEDISEALPFLNAELGGTQYYKDPPTVMFHVYGKIIKVSGREIAVNALQDEAEADKIITWLKNEINRVWENREHITPSETTPEKPKLIEILKLLPKTNCKKCGLATCMVFAAQVMEGGRGAGDCPELSSEQRLKLEDYLSQFQLHTL
ncbi:MAG: Fe-S cluster protein [Desulfobacterales bacterium]|jgi:ArsR family metal-binding transcriptional regulator|nr:Fe-S cluster protein [Desulfobacterales bacterium]